MHTLNPSIASQTKKIFFTNVLSIFLASCLIAAMAQISLPLWFTPIPVTLQTFAILFLTGWLGKKRAVAATLLYLAEGAMGLPVFSGFSGGFALLMGPKMGYLLAFPLAAYITGWLLERGWQRRFFSTFSAMLIGLSLIYFFGVLCLTFFVGSVKSALLLGFYPFLPGCLLKAFIASGLVKKKAPKII